MKTQSPGCATSTDASAILSVKDDDFAKALLSIWLGDPPDCEIKVGPFDGACG